MWEALLLNSVENREPKIWRCVLHTKVMENFPQISKNLNFVFKKTHCFTFRPHFDGMATEKHMFFHKKSRGFPLSFPKSKKRKCHTTQGFRDFSTVSTPPNNTTTKIILFMI